MNSNHKTVENKTKCSVCQQPFSCNVKLGTSCWCMSLPRLNNISSMKSASCLCPSCITIQTSEHIKTLYKTEGLASLLEIAQANKTSNNLIEHIDYTIENTYTVFTHWYHLKRGTCCQNSCKNCPYKSDAFAQFK